MSIICGNYISEKILGSGAYGEVHIVHSANDVTKKYALKKSIVTNTDGISGSELREIEILLRVNHPNVIYAEEAFLDINNDICVVLPLAQTDLKKYIKSHREFYTPEMLKEKDLPPQIKDFIDQLICGVEYLHRNNIVHQDLKPENLLIKDGVLKIADFGISTFHTDTLIPYLNPVQTIWYCSPEILTLRLMGNSFDGSQFYTDKIDIWSVGIIITEMLIGGNFITADTDGEMLRDIACLVGALTNDQKRVYLKKYPGKRSEILECEKLRSIRPTEKLRALHPDKIKLILDILVTDPIKRPSAKDLVKTYGVMCDIGDDIKYDNSKVYYTWIYTQEVREKVLSSMKTYLENYLPTKSIVKDIWLLSINVLDRYLSTDGSIGDLDDIYISADAAMNIVQKIILTNVETTKSYYKTAPLTKYFSIKDINDREMIIIQTLAFELYNPTVLSRIYNCYIYNITPDSIGSCLQKS